MRKLLAAFLMFLSFSVFAITTVPGTTYRLSGWSGNHPSPGAAAAAAAAEFLVQVAAFACKSASVVSANASEAVLHLYFGAAPCTGVGSDQTYAMVVTANSCPVGQGLKGSYCTDAATADGACKPGGVESFMVPHGDGSSPKPMALNGCAYEPASATNQCAYQGVQQWCGVMVSTGVSATPGSGGVVGIAATGAGSSIGVPVSEDTSCGTNKITNTSTGVSTCVTPSDANPIKKFSASTDAAGNKTTSTTVTGDPTKASGVVTTRTPIGGSTMTTADGAPVALYVPNCVDTECRVSLNGAAVVSGSTTFAEATTALDTSSTARETAVVTLSGSGKVSSLGLALDFAFPTTGACTPFHWAFKGYTYDYDWCTDLGTVRSLWAWMVGIIGALYVWRSGKSANA